MANKITKKLGFWSIVLFGVNSIIGTGIFLTPGTVIKQAGLFAPLAYLLAGGFAIILSVVFATAAKYTKENGAAFAYTKAAFGENVGLYVGITRAISAGIAWGVMVTAVIKTIFEIFLKELTMQSNANTYYFIGVLLLFLILLIINFIGTKLVELVSNISTVGKLTALAVFVLSGVIFIIFHHTNNYAQAGTNVVYTQTPLSLFGFIKLGENDWTGIIVATISALYAFTGFENIANAAEDMENPDQFLPKAIPLAIVIVGITYISVVLVAMFLGPIAIAHADDTVKLAAVIGNDILKMFVILGALISMFGINVATSFGSPRIFVALADKGILPPIVAQQSKRGVPVIAFLITASLALIFPLALSFDVSSLAGLSVIVRFIQYILVPIAVIIMAKSKTEKWQHIKRNNLTDYIFPIIAIVASVFLVLMYDYKTIIYHAGNQDLGLNYASIIAIILLFFIIPFITYIYYHNTHKNTKKRGI